LTVDVDADHTFDRAGGPRGTIRCNPDASRGCRCARGDYALDKASTG